MGLRLDRHIIDCETCNRVGHAIIAYEATRVPPMTELTEEQLRAYTTAKAKLPPIAIPADDFDHFVDACCDGEAVFAGIRLVPAGNL